MERPVVGVYLTFPDVATAERIATALVEAGLVACVNLLPATSLYRWGGRVVREAEVVAWAKTTRDRLEALTALVAELHPYDVPCVVAYPTAGGAAPYLDWVRAETADGG
jgi:periplasmic divalent cation tolerance protein